MYPKVKYINYLFFFSFFYNEIHHIHTYNQERNDFLVCLENYKKQRIIIRTSIFLIIFILNFISF